MTSAHTMVADNGYPFWSTNRIICFDKELNSPDAASSNSLFLTLNLLDDDKFDVAASFSVGG